MGVIAKYKFNNTLEANLLPEFNSEFTSDLYTITDEVNGEVTTRTIESDSLPTLMRFGSNLDTYVEGSEVALLEILDMNTSGLTSCYRMFRYCTNLTSINCDWDTSNVTTMFAMFGICNKLTSLDLSNFDTSKVTNMYYMFHNCTNLTTLDVSNWDTSSVTNMNNMFSYCNKLTSLDVSSWDTSNVTNMGHMFYGCSNLSSLDVSNFNISNVTNMSSMFSGCKLLTLLDVSNFNTGNVTNMNVMFHNATKLTDIIGIENWDVRKVTNTAGMFSLCQSLTSLDLSNWNTDSLTTVIYNDGSSAYGMFQGCSTITEIKFSEGFDTSKVTNMYQMFYGCINLISLDVSNWNTSKVTDMKSMFNKCNKLTTLDVSNFDTSKVTTMEGMFSNCQSLTSLDVSNFDTSNVTSMYAMFGDCHALISIEGINNFDVRKVQNFGNIFISCRTLQHLDLHNWTTSTDAQHQGMFAYCNNLHTIDISNFIFLGSSDGRKLLFYNSPNIKYIKCNNIITIDIIKSQLPTKSSTSQGTIICKSDITNLDTTALQSKYWNILDEPTLIAKYVFDKSIHNNCIPEFNTEFEGYFIEDEVVEGSNEVIRTIESCGMLPTKMRFGNITSSSSLLEILDIDTSALTSMWSMFLNCSNLTSVSCNWNTTSVTDMWSAFSSCYNLASLDVSNFDTSKVTNMNYLFGSCVNLTSLDVSNWNTSNVTSMYYTFYNCNNLTSLDVSNFDTTNVTNMQGMFYNCKKLTSLNISNWDTSKVTNTTDMFISTPRLTNISVLYMDKSSLQKLVDAIPTDSNKTLWYKDVNIDGITHGDNITLKKYMEGNVEIVLNSPLLEGDSVEVVDGKLCHVHRYGKIVLDGSEDWQQSSSGAFYGVVTIGHYLILDDIVPEFANLVCNTLVSTTDINFANKDGNNCVFLRNSRVYIRNNIFSINEFKQWLQANPTTIVYELTEPYYEDITNLQSAPTLKTYLECSMEIDTDLPIDTNVTYRTNLSSVYVMERELDELDNGTDLGDILEGEVNE